MSGKPAPLLLLVDDFKDNREMYAQYLGHAGYRVAEAENGRQALDQAFALLPDLIVMDLSLPGLDGWEATRLLKADPRTKAIPLLALTGNALTGYATKRASEAGWDAFLTKPCLPSELEGHVRRLLEARPKPGPAAKKKAQKRR